MRKHTPISKGIDAVWPVSKVVAQTGLSRTTLWRRIKAKDFPRPVFLSERKIGFRESEVKAWLAARPRVNYPGTAA